jgi:hypothetical protein
MNFDASQKARKHGEYACNPFQAKIPQKVGDAMQPNCMQALVASNDLEAVPSCRVSGNDGVDLVEEGI